jgi:hypothetical protein
LKTAASGEIDALARIPRVESVEPATDVKIHRAEFARDPATEKLQ